MKARFRWLLGAIPLRVLWFGAVLGGTLMSVSAIPRVIGGGEVNEEAFPWMALIAEADARDLRRSQIATAVLIHPRFVLTSAHSVRARTGEALEVLFDAPDLRRSAGKRVAVVDVVIHPGFVEEDGLFRNDVALLRLAEAVTDRAALPVAGNEEMEAPGSVLTVLGWASSSKTGNQSGSARFQTVMTALANEEANGLGSFAGRLDDAAFLPLGIGNGSTDGSPEESSLPVLAWVGDSPVLAGLASFGDACGQANGVRVCTRMRLMQPWIDALLLPGYGSWAAGRGWSGGPLADSDGNGETNLSDYALASLTSSGIFVGTQEEGGTAYREVRFLGPQGLSAEVLGQGYFSAGLGSWDPATLLPVNPAPGSPGLEEWSFLGPELEADSGLGFLRFVFEPGTGYVPAAKPVAFPSNWPLEQLLPEDRLDDSRPEGSFYVRDYALMGLPGDRPFSVRVQSEDFFPGLWIVREDSGEILASSPGADGRMGASLDFDPEAGVTYLARVGSYLPEAQGTFSLNLRESEGPPAIGVPTQPILVEGVEGTNPASVTFDVSNTGGGFLDFTVASGDLWIVAQTSGGGLESGEKLRVRIGFNVEGLGYGSFNGSVVIDGGAAGQAVVSVEMTLLPDLPHIKALHQGIYSLDLNDTPNPWRPGEYMDEYLFTTSEAGFYQISMTSAFIDTYLYLFDFSTGQLMVEQDDNYAVGNFRDASFGINLPANGSYIIVASCWGAWWAYPQNTGAYGLTVAKIQ
ncbi:MAG TPA: trypsin-like serine protease [Verrucomicrobiales bacterium]|nr:trypsin-like serine protease [Verrucomicrobiales bacterium]